MEKLYNKYLSGFVLKLGGQTSKILDKGSMETFGPFGLEKKLKEISMFINSLSNGVVTSYALYILIGLIFYISILYFSSYYDIYYQLLIMLFTLINLNYVFLVKNRL